MSTKRPARNARIIYDVLYGFIPITEWEEKLINSPFFQRLRWIKQLGFANYIFPGAEHTRFAHTIGVMHSMDQMLHSLGLAVPDQTLFSKKAKSKAAMLHKNLRIAALLHDIGTFPFSHVIETAYIRHGIDHRRTHKKPKALPNSHEHLGSFIIKNTDYEDGITRILNEYDFDAQQISKIIKGDSSELIANQLMHSDLDADRMDYLMRDAHYTGMKYGQFDREYIMTNLATYEAGRNQIGFGVRENAIHAVEDFLIARFSWYSQVIKNRDSAKFDVMAAYLAKAFLEKDLMHQFQDLLELIKTRDERFFWWNDFYFISKCQEILQNKPIRDPRILELTKMLLYRRAPKTMLHPLFTHRIFRTRADNRKKNHEREQVIHQISRLIREFESVLKNHGTHHEWILTDIPQNDVIFTTGLDRIVQRNTTVNLYMERDPIKIIAKDGSLSLLVERDNSLMKYLSEFMNFIPNVYANPAAIQLLQSKKLLT